MSQTTRYNSVAISLHWLIAILILGLVILSQVMTSYPEDDPFRFELIQWHKSFGIMTLLLVAFRLLWRLTHRPPRLPSGLGRLERLAANGAHVVLYLLMFLIPVSGWVMVSASPLNLSTVLFGLIPWPHIPILAELPEKATIAEQFLSLHHLFAKVLIAVVVLHVLASLRHYIFLKDGVMSRMFLSPSHGRDNNQGMVFGLLIALAGALFLFHKVQQASVLAGSSQASESRSSGAVAGADVSRVGFTALQLGEDLNGVFEESDVALLLDQQDPAASRLNAIVKTASVNTGDGQIDATIVTADWFATADFPDATFVSTQIDPVADDEYTVTGVLTIREVSQSITFAMSVAENLAAGVFTIDRKSFGVGNSGQDDFIDASVTIKFEVTITHP